MGPNDGAAVHQLSKVFLEQHHLLLTSRAYWLDEPSAEGKLLYEEWRGPSGSEEACCSEPRVCFCFAVCVII